MTDTQSPIDPEPRTVLIVDLECTCDQPNFADEEMEIIELGVVIASLSPTELEVLDSRSLMVQPQIHRTLSHFCRELTGITQPQVDQAPALQEALSTLRQWISPHAPVAWGSWGKFDLKQLNRECEFKGIPQPLDGMAHENLKARYAKRYQYQMGLKPAVTHSKLTFLGRHHSGIDDALNIANLLRHREALRQDWYRRLLVIEGSEPGSQAL